LHTTALPTQTEENAGSVGDAEMPDANESSDMEAEAAAGNTATNNGTGLHVCIASLCVYVREYRLENEWAPMSALEF
jgi:hypothetical protein